MRPLLACSRPVRIRTRTDLPRLAARRSPSGRRHSHAVGRLHPTPAVGGPRSGRARLDHPFTSATSAAGMPAPSAGSTQRGDGEFAVACAPGCSSRARAPPPTSAQASCATRCPPRSSRRPSGSSRRSPARSESGREWAGAPRILLTQWSRLLLEKLVRAASPKPSSAPGSRSTPFVWAALHTPGLACHSVVDERAPAPSTRSAWRASPRRPPCCSAPRAAPARTTSLRRDRSRPGHACRWSCSPPIVPSSSRTLRRRRTIDQTRLYGPFARRSYELGQPDREPERARRALSARRAGGVPSRSTPNREPCTSTSARKPLGAYRRGYRAECSRRRAPRPTTALELVADGARRSGGYRASRCNLSRSDAARLIVLGPSAPSTLPSLAAWSRRRDSPCSAKRRASSASAREGAMPRDRLIDGFDPLLRSPDLLARPLPGARPALRPTFDVERTRVTAFERPSPRTRRGSSRLPRSG